MGEASRRRFLVNGKRQKSQMKLAFEAGGEGEAFKTLHEGTEPHMVKRV
jgi:hypothetical protein